MPDLMLAHLPTPLEPADRLAAALGLPRGRLWVKREDCTGLASGGNKARKLVLLVADALARGDDVLVSGGGPQSNHARLTAAAAARAGMDCVLAFTGDRPERIESNQLLEVLFGAERRFVGLLAMDELNAAIQGIAGELRAAGRRPYAIPVGGSSPLGASAYSTAADEIVAQLGHEDVLVITATGSGGTQAGLAARLGHDRVFGVDSGAIADPVSVVRRLAIDVAGLRGLPAPSGMPRMARDQIGDGYGAPTDACLAALRLAARTEGLLLDPVYAGKAMAGLMAMPGSDLGAVRAVVFLVTGGVPSLFESRYEKWLSGPEREVVDAFRGRDRSLE
jgi:1-aminocyclopropane-1-carboxylate deaminase/D-cysteine desulfhydrase-like pyridoxal-dependent ACC family enzyme